MSKSPHAQLIDAGPKATTPLDDATVRDRVWDATLDLLATRPIPFQAWRVRKRAGLDDSHDRTIRRTLTVMADADWLDHNHGSKWWHPGLFKSLIRILNLHRSTEFIEAITPILIFHNCRKDINIEGPICSSGTMPNDQSRENGECGSSSKVPRRQLLSGVGATMLASPIVGSVSAKKTQLGSKKLREQANKIRQNAGQKAWKKYLRAHGCGIKTISAGIKPDKSGGVSTQKFDNIDGNSSDCDICLEFSLYYDSLDNYSIDMFWTYDSEKWLGGGGYAPDDGLGIYFNPLHWDFRFDSLSQTTYTSNKGIVSVEDDTLNSGLPFSVDDSAAGDGTSYWAGVHVSPIGDYSEFERYVYGDYIHTWNEYDPTYSMDVSYPGGLSMSFGKSSEVKSEGTSTEGDGDTLMRINQVQSQP